MLSRQAIRSESDPGSDAGASRNSLSTVEKRGRQEDARELAFLDAGIPELPIIFENLRPEVEAFVFHGSRPVARQMSDLLSGRANLRAIHVIAHGAPGRVAFSAGHWSRETLSDSAGDFATIGRSLDEGGALGLWSCESGAGAEGAAFILTLSEATGRPVAAASHKVGAAAHGGTWQLDMRTRSATARPPMTEVGMGIYAGILIAEVIVTGTVPIGNVGGPVTYYLVDTDRQAIVGQVMLPEAMPQETPVSMSVKVPNALAPLAIGTFDPAGGFQVSTRLSVVSPARPVGAVGSSGQ